MNTKLAKWGNSLAVRIPSSMAQEAGIGNGDTMDLSLVDGTLVLTPRRSHVESLDELLDNLDPETLHGEVNWGPPVGKEVW